MVISIFLKTFKLNFDFASMGKSFHNRASVLSKRLEPYVALLDVGTTKCDIDCVGVFLLEYTEQLAYGYRKRAIREKH